MVPRFCIFTCNCAVTLHRFVFFMDSSDAAEIHMSLCNTVASETSSFSSPNYCTIKEKKAHQEMPLLIPMDWHFV